MAIIHPTAVVNSSAVLADDVEVAAGAVVEADVTIGAGTILRAHSVVRRYTTLGENNMVDHFTVLGGEPQDLKFDPAEVSYLKIGDGNIFREGVTINRATGKGEATVVGNNTYWMTQSHAGHNAVIEDDVILGNSSGAAGHATVHRGAILSAGVFVHQFCWIGERVMTQGNAGFSTHVPPYSLVAGINRMVSLNKIGLRRAADISAEDRRQIQQAFDLTYRRGLSLSDTLAEMDAQADWGPAAIVYREFIRKVLAAEPPFNRGLCPLRKKR
ncbi:MAG: acyl-ACP--UDP-N-acetylglucosamine O-acyltransferase [Phycisphaerae bacterium]|nr:acyl-ACP--UDP-N-acetylglucosamine O-acyltransferase [Phycisphaerae bacterium]